MNFLASIKDQINDKNTRGHDGRVSIRLDSLRGLIDSLESLDEDFWRTHKSAIAEKHIVKNLIKGMTEAGYNVDQSSALTVLKVILNDLQETSARLKKISVLADETLSPPTLGQLT
jgi:hypothetical protein